MSWAAPKTRTRGTEQKRSVGGIKKTPTWAPSARKLVENQVPGAPKMLQNGSWAGLGALLGRSWGLPGLLGGSWSLLGRSLGALGAFLGAPGAVLGRSLDVLGRPWGSIWAPGALLLDLFWSPLRAAWQNHENIENRCFFNGFQGFSRFRAPQIAPKSSQNRSEEALGHQVGPESLPKVTWEALETLWKASGRPGKRVGRPTRRTSFPEPGSPELPPRSRRTAGEG